MTYIIQLNHSKDKDFCFIVLSGEVGAPKSQIIFPIFTAGKKQTQIFKKRE